MKKNLPVENPNGVLGRKDVMGMAVGQIIGSGIMALTGLAIGYTGKGLVFAFLLAAVLTTCYNIPLILFGGTVPLKGGFYSQAGHLLGKKFSGAFAIVWICSNVVIAMYPLAFADYFLSLVPGINRKLIAMVVLTVVFLLNLFGVKGAALVQNLMVVCLAAALALFVGFGLVQVDVPAFFTGGGFAPNGVMGFLTAATLLTMATGGASSMINLTAKCKNPTRDIPFVAVVATIIVALVYAVMGLVASGVLPIDVVANQPLTLVAAEILPKPLFVFFIVGGALFAIATTLNSTLNWVPLPFMQACEDGWFPKACAKTNKYGAPIFVFAVLYVLNAAAIVTGFDINVISSVYLVLGNAFYIFTAFAIFRLPRIFPNRWAASRFHLPKPALYAAALIGGCAEALICLTQMGTLSTPLILANVVFCALAFLYAAWREKHADVHLEYVADVPDGAVK